MERKEFLAAAVAVAATAAAAGVAVAGTPASGATRAPPYSPYPGGSPNPGQSPHPHGTRGQGSSDDNLQRVHHHLEKMIDLLQHDQHDYCGHREQAIDLLQQARAQIEAGLACDQQH
jgi:hypothetical protein